MSTRPSPRTGFAMVIVLLVLMALFVLCAPFLLTVRNADQASAQVSDRSNLHITLDAAARHALGKLGSSHPALDSTPYFDDLAELEVTNRFPASFLATRDPRQVMWDVESEDVAGRIDLSSASPHVIANLIGGAARLTALCKDKDVRLEVSDTRGFLPEGVVFVEGEVIGYAELAPTSLLRLTRGLLVKTDSQGQAFSCGRQPPGAHEIGAFVIDQRAWALAEWRLATGTLRTFDGIEQVREAKDFMLSPEFGREAYLALERTTSPFGHVRSGERWQRAVRVVGQIDGEPPYGCRVPVDEGRWFNAGTTVRITDGTSTELRLVRDAGPGAIVVDPPLEHEYKPYETVVQPLARTPVNVNTASPEVLTALWTNLKLRGKSARITAGEAQELVDLALASRPFTGFEDFLRRFVLPAGGLDELPKDATVQPEKLAELGRQSQLDAQGKKHLVGIVDPEDAVALYKNALNANDDELEFATMPLCFASRDVYELSLRASVNSPSGGERASGVRELTQMVVPQRDLLQVWTRQEDFDLAPRLDLCAANWLTGPVPTSRYDPMFGVTASMRWPTRARANLGVHDTVSSVDPLAGEEKIYCFADREEDGWVQLAPEREEDSLRRASYALHFDDESKTLEGRYLPDGTVPLDLAKLGWAGAGGLMSSVACSLWVQPRELEEGARLLDVGGSFTDSDRLSLLFEGGDLVLRVLDGVGDHPDTTFHEQAELRYALSGEGPGLPPDVWTHVQIAVDGTRPDQMALLVDGRRSTRTPGLTRLSGALAGTSDTIQVESTEGFPDKCVLRIGDELIEAIKKGEKSFSAKFESAGENAGFGGRAAREQFRGVIGAETNLGLFKDLDHPSGSTVELYGYSLPFFSNVPSAGSALPASLGPFAVARVAGIVKSGSEQDKMKMERIETLLVGGGTLLLGWGLDSQGSGQEVEALVLEAADPNANTTKVMEAFSPNGGYAALLGVRFDFPVTDPLGTVTQVTNDSYGVRLGGVEVIRYSGWDGKHLRISQRGDEVALPQLRASGVSPDVAGRGAYIFYYSDELSDANTGARIWFAHNQELASQVMVVPISIPLGSSGGVAGFPPGVPGRSEFAQITRTGPDTDMTEWVRYDDVTSDQLVRDDWSALLEANAAAHAGTTLIQTPFKKGPPANGGANGPGGGPRQTFSIAAPLTAPAPAAPPARSTTPPRSQGGQSVWYYGMGETEDDDFFITRAVRTHLQFRGVLGTFSHAQPSGTMVLPAFKAQDFAETGGWPGRFDSVGLLSDDPAQPSFPATVHRSHRPLEYTRYTWTDPGGGAFAAKDGGNPTVVLQAGMDVGVTYVALQAGLPVFFPATPLGDLANPTDTRRMGRMALFPSGELPRNVQKGQLGGDVRGRGSVPSAIVDEALFFPSSFPLIAGMSPQLVLAKALSDGDKTFTAEKDGVRTMLDFVTTNNLLASMPANGGLLRMGDELLCYDSYDADTFVFTIPPSGRGLLGTEPQPHRVGEGITWVGSLPLGILSANIGADDANLPLLDVPPGFPSQGTVRIEDELAHYTSFANGILRMPRGSGEPGEMDEKGPGLFRGRYGTERAGHGVGTPVILFPSRYWDRWSERADAPEMSYFQLSCDQPDAFWRRVFWKAEEAGYPGPELGVLQRTDESTHWDAAPDDAPGLRLLWKGKLDGDGNPIGVQADRVEWRVFVRHRPGSFDTQQGLAHGWKTTPRLELFGVESMGPGRTLARMDR